MGSGHVMPLAQLMPPVLHDDMQQWLSLDQEYHVTWCHERISFVYHLNTILRYILSSSLQP